MQMIKKMRRSEGVNFVSCGLIVLVNFFIKKTNAYETQG